MEDFTNKEMIRAAVVLSTVGSGTKSPGDSTASIEIRDIP